MVDRDEVIVVGAGPVGVTAALLLARQGIRVTVLERGSEVSRASRASTFHPPTLDLLDDLDVTEELVSVGLIADRYQMRDRQRGVFAEFDLAVLRGDTAHPYRVQCEQSTYTAMAYARLREEPVAEVHFSHCVTGIAPATDHVNVEVEVNGQRTGLSAAWVIAADGASSVIRHGVGIRFDGMTYPERYLVVTTPFELRDVVPDLAYVNYVSDPTEFVVLLRLPDVWRAMFPIPPEESDAAALNEFAVQRRLHGLANIDAQYPIQHQTMYHVHQRIATTFRAGRVLLAGDAAHINNPLGGMGMNSGIQDAFMLAQRLARVIRGEERDTALDVYAAYRRDVAMRYVRRLSHENAEQMQEPDDSQRRRQQKELSRVARTPELAREYLRARMLIDALEEQRALA